MPGKYGQNNYPSKHNAGFNHMKAPSNSQNQNKNINQLSIGQVLMI